MRRRSAAATLLLAGCAARPAAIELPRGDLEFLRELARDTLGLCRNGASRRALGFAAITPAGRGGYPAFWIRDFCMSLDARVIPLDEVREHVRCIAKSQNGVNTLRLAHGLEVPPHAIPDHITVEGGAVFYPGTYSSGHDQGNGAFGVLPPADDHYEFVHAVAWMASETSGIDAALEVVDGRSLLERADAGYRVPEHSPETGLVRTSEQRRCVGFGFCDAIVMSGELLFPSLLRRRAAQELAHLWNLAGDPPRAAALRGEARTIEAHLAERFRDPLGSGFLLAATELGRQPDVWGTLFALHEGALDSGARARALDAVEAAVRSGTILYEGAVRHVPTDRDASPESAWDRTVGAAKNTYQNGAYWHTPTGWLVEALAERNPELARRVAAEFLDHLRRHDFRLGPSEGAPWECFGAGLKNAQNAVYLTSILVPLGCFERAAGQR
ncbi:MAG: hypothetical protein JNJ88_15740 [Planctomycetes bacterium]|nr:hypothetical protein [Planctomycetota bacterium]